MNMLGRMSNPRRATCHEDKLGGLSEQEEFLMLKRDVSKDKPRTGGHGRTVVFLVACSAVGAVWKSRGLSLGAVWNSVQRRRRFVANSNFGKPPRQGSCRLL